MERLTIPDEKIDERTTRMTVVDAAAVREHAMKFYWRLKAYEDTGLTPESVEALKLSIMGKAISEIKEFNGLPIDRLRELAEADKDGRVVVLPCKVGDTAWVKDRAGVPREMRLESPDIRFVCTDEDNLCMSTCNRTGNGLCAYRIRNDGTDIGKRIFPTREEAEAAWNRRDNNG